MPLMKKGLPSFMKRVPLIVRPPGSDGAAGNDGPAEVVAHALNTRPPAATAAPCRISRRLGSRMRALSHAVSRGSSACTGSVLTGAFGLIATIGSTQPFALAPRSGNVDERVRV